MIRFPFKKTTLAASVWRIDGTSLGRMQGGSQKVRLEGEGHMLPKQAVFFTPLCLCTCYSLFLLFPFLTVPFPPSPTEKSHLCVHGIFPPATHHLLSCSHMIICCPSGLAWKLISLCFSPYHMLQCGKNLGFWPKARLSHHWLWDT